jgi:phosphoribosylglycinamide formyltransferase 1
VSHAVPRLAVLLSGGGRSLANLLQEIEAGRLEAEVPLVVASRECGGVEIARRAGVGEVRVIKGEIPTQVLGEICREAGIEWVILAGYLKFVHVPPGFERRVLNIHPSLLPKFGGPGMYGHHVHEAVIRAGERESGCTVHYVDGEFDHGPVILQRRCPVLPGDTPETLAARVFALECQAYPEAIRNVLAGRASKEAK